MDPATAARRGRITTPHGTIETPAFMPVGTSGTVKGMTPEDLEGLGFEVVLGNTYHLALRPGEEVVRRLGGLHRFMGWERVILTDSGGFQVLSLAELRTMTDEGVSFRSHLDGSLMAMTPERSMQIQASLGSDIVMAFDDCPALPSPRLRILEAVRRTSLWARRSREALLGPGQALFGIVQGGDDPGLREQSAEEITALGFDGYAIGGVSVGESADLSREVVALTAPRLPPDRPRYLMDGNAGRPGRDGGPRMRSVRLRAADAQRAQRDAVHFDGPPVDQEERVRGRPATGRRGMLLPGLPAFLTRLPAAPVRGRRDPVDASQHPA